MSLRLVQATISVLAALMLLATACSTPSATPGNPRATPLPATPLSQVDDASRSTSAAAPLNASQLRLAYQLILQRFVDRVDHTMLIDAAYGALREALHEDGALPLDTAIVDLARSGSADAERDWTAFARSYEALTRKYPDWASRSELDHRVLSRMMESLADGHSLFISPEEYRRRGETGYSGIGVRLDQPDGGQAPRIAEVFPDTPAAQAGLRASDRIVAVDGQSILGTPLSKVVDLIRGPEGSAVRLELERQGNPSQVQVSITRRAVEIPLVDASMSGPIAYLHIRGFGETAPPLVGAALLELKRLGPQGWVLDLRGNGGGRLDAVQAVAGMFLGERPIGIEVNRTRDRTPLTAQGPQLVEDIPMVVLIDSETASGAEILAEALREYRQAVVIGGRSAGNVAVAEEHPLPNGSAIQLTVRRFLGPSGTQIDRTGVEPDIPVPTTDADLIAGRDPQLARAVEVLAEKLR